MMLKNEKIPRAVSDAVSYFEVMTSFLEEMRLLQKELRELIKYIISIIFLLNIF